MIHSIVLSAYASLNPKRHVGQKQECASSGNMGWIGTCEMLVQEALGVARRRQIPQ